MQYDPNIHCYVRFKSGTIDGPSEQGIRAIVHHTNLFVWVFAAHSETLSRDVWHAGDGRDNGYDVFGNRIVTVPISLVEKYLTEDEANQIAQIEAIDQQMLRNAY
jgi:hypothetical protein